MVLDVSLFKHFRVLLNYEDLLPDNIAFFCACHELHYKPNTLRHVSTYYPSFSTNLAETIGFYQGPAARSRHRILSGPRQTKSA